MPSRLHNLLADEGIKRATTGGVALIGLSLVVAFALLGDQSAIYALVLSLGAFLLMLWAFPATKLGLTAVFLFVQPLLIYLANTEYGYTKAVFSLGMISLLSLVWLGEMAFKGRLRLLLPPPVWPALFLLGALLLSLTNSEALLADLQYVALFTWFALFFLFLANVATDLRQVRFLLGALLLSAALASAYGLSQYFGVLAGAPDHANGSGAMIATFGNPNYLGGFLAYLVVPGLLLCFFSRRWVRRGAVLALALITVTLVAIDSDSAWLAYFLSVVALVVGLAASRRLEVLCENWRSCAILGGLSLLFVIALYIATELWVRPGPLRAPASPWQLASLPAWGGLGALALLAVAGWVGRWVTLPWLRRQWAAVAAILLVVIGVSLTPAGQEVIGGMGKILVGRAGVRVEDWQIGIHMFRTHPLIGIGLGDYKREFLPYKARFLSDVGHLQRGAQAHNEYVQILAELGIVGVLSVAALVGALVWGLVRRLARADSSEGAFCLLALFGGMVAFMSDSAFSFPLHLPANALVLTALVGMLQARVWGETGVIISLGPRAAQGVAGVALVAALVVGVFAYRDWRADVHLDRAKRLLQTGNDRRVAEALLEESVRLDFAPGEALYWLGFLELERAQDLLSRGEGQEAREGFSRARGLLRRSLSSFNTESTYFYLALASQRLGELEAAERHLETLLAIDPSPSLRLDALQLRALILYQRGRVQEGIEALRRLIESHPRSPRLLFTLGQMYLEQGALEKAQERLTQARQLIDEELAALDRRLSPESTRTVPLATYARWRGEREALASLKETIEALLEQLPP